MIMSIAEAAAGTVRAAVIAQTGVFSRLTVTEHAPFVIFYLTNKTSSQQNIPI